MSYKESTPIQRSKLKVEARATWFLLTMLDWIFLMLKHIQLGESIESSNSVDTNKHHQTSDCHWLPFIWKVGHSMIPMVWANSIHQDIDLVWPGIFCSIWPQNIWCWWGIFITVEVSVVQEGRQIILKISQKLKALIVYFIRGLKEEFVGSMNIFPRYVDWNCGISKNGRREA